ncbi:TonB-dependent receptor [Hymenobacter sp. BT730]|uniref:TonB-dependent receptor domain-containing protein n=1 Tax=Hymenobacter sp. BT730 TaxID=3063332 RepID=UPI0026E02F21|nr:TonB-dependent receptor [Hymenobacter sp. BT730]
MKIIFACLLFLVFSGSTHWGLAQGVATLTGTVFDAQRAAVPFVNVVVVQPKDSAFVGGTVSDLQGAFRLDAPPAGQYQLHISGLGYNKWVSPVFELSTAAPSRDFGSVVLAARAQLLSEVTVQAQKPLVTQLADRTVVNVEGTALAAGNTVFDVLSRAPGVFVDQDGNVQLNGKAGVQVLLDGKRVYLTGKELQSLLQSMPADNLRTLELMANPSARFDAEGTAGVINLTFKKKLQAGLNGSVYAGTQYNGQAGYTTGATLNGKRGAWSSVGSLDLARRPNLRTSTLSRTFAGAGPGVRFEQEGEQTGTRTTPALRLGTDYEFNSQHSMGVTANLVSATEDNTFTSVTQLGNGAGSSAQRVEGYNVIANRLASGNFNLHYLGKLDTLGTTLTADADYVTLRESTRSDFENRYLPGNGAGQATRSSLRTNNPVRYDIYAAQADYTKPLTAKTKLELGAKLSQVRSDNELAVVNSVGEQRLPDATRSNHFVYREAIRAGYATLSTGFGPKWQVQAGLRAEYTRSTGSSLTLDSTTARRYLDFFPSVFVQQNVSQDYQVSYQHSRRISRPRYEDLNPFVFFLDPYTLAVGNSQLRPQYTNTWQVSQTYKSTYTLALGVARTRDYIAEIPTQRPQDMLTIMQQRNVQRFDQLNATLSAPVRLGSKWQMNNTLSMAYQHFQTELLGQAVSNRRLHYFLQSSQQVQLPGQLKLEVSGIYLGPQAYGIYQVRPLWWVDAGVKRSFLLEQLDVSLNVTDLFRSRQLRGAFQAEGSRTAFDLYRGNQSVALQLRYSFRRGSAFKAKNRTTTLDEFNRASD